MFGLTRREQRWKADQEAAAPLVSLASTAILANAQIQVAEAHANSEVTALREEIVELKRLLQLKINYGINEKT